MTDADRPRRLSRRRELPPVPAGLARAPVAVPPSAWVFPDLSEADLDGVVGVGADLAPGTLVDAYRRGVFPWPHPGVSLPWFSPDPRGVLELDGLVVSRSLARTLRRSGWETTVDTAFSDVVAACAEGRGEEGTWITGPMRRAYERLHELGWAHSVEVWAGDRLVGGLYGVQTGGVFTGESMFHRVTDASKVALVDLVVRLRSAGGHLVDVQVVTPHLASLGARNVPREHFIARLQQARELDVRLTTTRLPAERLAPSTGAPPRS